MERLDELLRENSFDKIFYQPMLNSTEFKFTFFYVLKAQPDRPGVVPVFAQNKRETSKSYPTGSS